MKWSMKLKILLIEDEPGSIEIISLIFKVSHPDSQMLYAKFGKEGIDLIKKEAPDIVILDMGLPDIDGCEVLKRIRLFSNIPIVVLTVRGEENDVVKALALGANEYIVKPFRQFEFLARLNNVMNNNKKTDMETSSLYIGNFKFDVSSRILSCERKNIQLTGTESQILYHLLINKNKTVTYNSFYKNIWGEYYPGGENTLRVHIQRLRKKIMSIAGSNNLIITKSGIGYTIKL